MKELNELIKLSHAVGAPMDYTQGGGGNTSVKLENGVMAIKASGMLMRDMTEKDGFAAVRYEKVLEYMANVERGVPGRDYNAEINDAAMSNIVNLNGEKERRPSCEVGFHSVLKKFVAHTHSVYANVLTCSEGGPEEGASILKNAGIEADAVPEMAPGYYLTEFIEKVLKRKPGVRALLLQNHGIIVHADTADECIALHKAANDAFIKALGLSAFPLCAVKKVKDGFASDTPWLRERFADEKLFKMSFGAPILPDQIVYTQHPDKFIYAGADTVYLTESEKQAQAIEETLCGVCYILEEIMRLDKTIRFLSDAGIAYVTGWDVEKYRRELLK